MQNPWLSPTRLTAAILLAAFTLNAHAIALIPTRVRNDTSVTVHITVARFANCFGPEKGSSGPWSIETTIAPHQEDTLLLMGGAQGSCSGGVSSITIETAPTTPSDPNSPPILPLHLTDNFPDHWSHLHIQVDPQTHSFLIRPITPTPNTQPSPRSPKP